jgi:hypothetical protein
MHISELRSWLRPSGKKIFPAKQFSWGAGFTRLSFTVTGCVISPGGFGSVLTAKSCSEVLHAFCFQSRLQIGFELGCDKAHLLKSWVAVCVKTQIMCISVWKLMMASPNSKPF